MQYKKALKKTIVFFSIFICATVILAVGIGYIYSLLNTKYIEKKRTEYQPKIQFVTEILNTEKEWIRQNQGQNGEIFLNKGTGTVTVGDINPYFACFAAQSLLSLATQQDMESVKNYLKWHREQIILSNGIVTNYKTVDNTLLSTGKYDSVDSYLAVFISLLCQYGEMGGDLTEIDPNGQAINIALDMLTFLTKDGITGIKPDKEVFYFMDNIEVSAAYNDLYNLASGEKGQEWLKDDCLKIKEHSYNANIALIKSMKNLMWNSSALRFEVGVGKDNIPFEFEGFDVFYPCGVAQLYPIAFDVLFEGIDYFALYKTVGENTNWQNLEFGNDEQFNWGIICYISAKIKDEESAVQYLNSYKEKFRYNRDYPLHTADSGWVVRACEELYNEYNIKMNSSLINDILN